MPQGAFVTTVKRGAAAACAVCLLASSLAGCAAKGQPLPPLPPRTEVPKTAETPASSPAYDQAVAAFARGEYRPAAELFEAAAQANDPGLARRALYGQACAMLAAAETKEDYKAAKAKWREWAAMTPVPGSGEDPRLLGPALRGPRLPAEPRENGKPPKDVDCAKRLAEKEREVRVLGNQIKALEKIHREIQERKKELSSP